MKGAIRTLGHVTEPVEKKETTLAALRELLCPASTEKTAKVLEQAGIETGEKKPKPAGPESASQAPKSAATNDDTAASMSPERVAPISQSRHKWCS